VAKLEHACNGVVEQALPRKRDERVDDPPGVARIRDEEEIRAGPDRPFRPGDRVAAPGDVERVGHRDAAKTEVAEQAVCSCLEGRAPPPEGLVERVVDHHARRARPNRPPEACQLGAPDAGMDVWVLVRRDRRRPEAREVLHARGRARGEEAAKEGDAERLPSELARAQRPVGGVEHGGEIDVHSCALQSRARLLSRGERLACRGVRGRRLRRRKIGKRLDETPLLIGEDEPAAWQCDT